MKITDMLISSIVKKGVLYEARNFDSEIEVSVTIGLKETTVKIKITCEHMKLQVEKTQKGES